MKANTAKQERRQNNTRKYAAMESEYDAYLSTANLETQSFRDWQNEQRTGSIYDDAPAPWEIAQ